MNWEDRSSLHEVIKWTAYRTHKWLILLFIGMSSDWEHNQQRKEE
jgi:hypothetical protein